MLSSGGKNITFRNLLKVSLQNPDFRAAVKRNVPLVQQCMPQIRTFMERIPESAEKIPVCSSVRKAVYMQDMELRLEKLLLPTLEQVIALEPDLVILPNSAQEKYGATLESLEIPVYYIAMTSSGFSAYDVIRQQTAVFTEAFGTDTDRQTKGKEILSRFDTLDTELAAFSEKTEGMSVFAITVSGDQIYTTSSTSTLGCMLELCGLENVFQPDASNGGHSLGTLDMETSISYDPDIMVICGSSTKEDNIAMMQALYEKNPSYWDAINAIRKAESSICPALMFQQPELILLTISAI